MTTPAVSRVVPAIFGPPTQGLGLSDVEVRVMAHLAAQLSDWVPDMMLSQLYAEGMNVVESLGIAVPPELEQLRAVLGWCGEALGARSERLTLQGFRMPGKTTVDDDLQQAWQANNLDAESVLVHNDAMTYRHSFAVVGVNENRDAPPLTTIESPLSMTASWDVRRREVSAAYQTYVDVDPASETYFQQLATLYTRNSTVQLVHGEQGWEVQNRNDHGMGFVPVIMFANRPTPLNRYGRSEIAPSWRNTQDRAARALVRNEVAAEFFASLKVWLLGVDKQTFQKADGTFATALETFTGRISMLEADQNGVLPQVVFQQGQDPTGMIKFIDHERQVFSGNSGTPLEYLGLVADGNPSSADAITKGDFRLMKTAERLATQFGNGWEDWGRMTLRVWGKPTEGAERLESDWGKFGIPTPNADTVRVTSQVGAGMVSPDSDDALTEVGWSPVQRARISASRKQAIADGWAPPGVQPAQQPMDAEQPAAQAGLEQSRQR
ncbi:phage portal protein [Mycolicibacterium fortuitum]|uniref:phage portal protein n=1 Tax=Mycolicibacterium fortuitum TaxID=1766 RepID=UPI0022BA5C80|nr:phage portal protein [Mycolicibacterium fortuitum]WAY18405.1 phage portal protein [Mycolicibacterium fortuitum]